MSGTTTISRLEVLRGCESMLRAQERLWAALWKEAAEDVKHEQVDLFVPFKREDLIRMHARVQMRKAFAHIFNRVTRTTPGEPKARRKS